MTPLAKARGIFQPELTMINILIVDDHKVVRDGIKFFLKDIPDFEIVSEVENGKKALELLAGSNVDLVLTDINMPEMDGYGLIENIKSHYPDVRIIVMTMVSDAKNIKKMIAMGVNGYVLKSAEKDIVIQAIYEVTSGKDYFQNDVTQLIIRDLTRKKKVAAEFTPKLSVDTELSKREKEVLKLILHEKSNNEIAEELFISVRTVETHKNNLLMKTGAKNVAGLVFYAIEHDLIE